MSARPAVTRLARCAQPRRAFHASVVAPDTQHQRQTGVKHQPEELTGSAKLLAEALEEEAEEARNPQKKRRTVADRAADDSP
jgi:hypothetical protein